MLLTSIWVFFLGASLGSFLDLCAWRIPSKEDFLFSRSACPQCKHVLGAGDLVPILSYLVLGGKCRYCQASIGHRCLVSELLAGLVFLALFLVYGFSSTILSYGTLGGLLMVGALVDLEHFYIPNGLVLFGIVTGIGLTLLTGHGGLPGAIFGLLAGGTPLLVVLLVSRGGMGAGDVKFGAMLGVFLGWRLTLLGLFLAFFSGAGVGVFLLATGRRRGKDPIPFGPFLAIGGVLSSLWGPALLELYLRVMCI